MRDLNIIIDREEGSSIEGVRDQVGQEDAN